MGHGNSVDYCSTVGDLSANARGATIFTRGVDFSLELGISWRSPGRELEMPRLTTRTDEGEQSRSVPPSHQGRVKVQFWVPVEKLEDWQRWCDAARGDGIELGPWLHKAANLALKMRGVLG